HRNQSFSLVLQFSSCSPAVVGPTPHFFTYLSTNPLSYILGQKLFCATGMALPTDSVPRNPPGQEPPAGATAPMQPFGCLSYPSTRCLEFATFRGSIEKAHFLRL